MLKSSECSRILWDFCKVYLSFLLILPYAKEREREKERRRRWRTSRIKMWNESEPLKNRNAKWLCDAHTRINSKHKFNFFFCFQATIWSENIFNVTITTVEYVFGVKLLLQSIHFWLSIKSNSVYGKTYDKTQAKITYLILRMDQWIGN